MQSLQLCPLWSTQNHLKLVCTFLLCRLFQGYVPPISWLQKYQLDGIFMEFIECLCQCNYVQADQWIVKHTAFLLKMGLFFILIDQLRYLMIRKCLRCCLSAYLFVSDPDLSKPRRMPLRYFASALDRMFQTLDQDATESLFSAYHKLTHLIAQGHARGYISLVHKIYVMPKTNDLKLIVAPIRAINT
ncbi:hypothetical protein HMI55_002093 [Coelomomyces lativittatus]|nr:hypothetical protein HMI55_002093 [Coelomomyces lativittatus]